MERDNMSYDDAKDLFDEAAEEARNVIENNGSLSDIEDILKDYFGLEPDYIFDIIDL
jgi:uncharacterized protein (UPF0262 family)